MNRFTLNDGDAVVRMDYNTNLDEDNLQRFIEEPHQESISYFGNKKSSINRLGEYNLAMGKRKNDDRQNRITTV